MAPCLHCHQRQRSTDIHKPNLCLVAYGRYAHKQGKDERQCAEAEFYLPQEQFFLILFYLIFSFCSPKPFSVHLPICVQPSLHLLLEEGSLELYHAAQAYLEQQHCWQYALGLYDFLLEGLWSVHSRSSFLPQNLLL